jgi:hypothetical protein
VSNVLTISQEMSLFQILEVPWQPEPTRFMDADNSVVVKLTISGGARQARESILTYLATYILPVDDAFNLFTSYLDRWREIGTTQVRIDTGGVGTLNGVVLSFEEERNEIRRQVIGIVPYYRAHSDWERKITQSAEGAGVQIMYR